MQSHYMKGLRIAISTHIYVVDDTNNTLYKYYWDIQSNGSSRG